MYLFYASTLGFDVLEEGQDVPLGAVAITNDQYEHLFIAQALGQRIVANEAGQPHAVDPPPMSRDALASAERIWRDAALFATDGVVARHRDELEEGVTTSLTPDRYVALQAYRRALRDWPEDDDFPSRDHRPPAPDWLAELLP